MNPDVIVVGSGNAAFSAALTAREHGATVLMLEKGSRDWIGGNSWFTAGAFRLTHSGVDDLRGLVEPLDEAVELPSYDIAAYEADMRRLTDHRCDPRLTGILVREAREAAEWMARQGVRWRLMAERQAHRQHGVLRFWGGLSVGSVGGGEGIIDAYLRAARDAGIQLRTDTMVVGLVRHDTGAIAGVAVEGPDGPAELLAGSVVLASGGFEASSDLRAQHMGERWRLARVRGTPHNTGLPLIAAIVAGAAPFGDWRGGHSIAWDAAAPAAGDRAISNRYSRQSYPYALVVNRHGRRFLDESADFRNYTYAKYGALILGQPDGIAFQLFDGRAMPYVSEIDYVTATASRFEADTLAGLASAAGIDPVGLIATVRGYNAAVTGEPIDPTILDGVGATGIEPPRSNWSQPFDRPPYVAYAVACGITFTFGGLRIDEGGAVIGTDGRPIRGLYGAGELVGGLFYGNYPGGTGLASGTVFGRRAGRAAAVAATAS